MVKKKHKIHVQQGKTYPGADICSDHNVVVMKYKLQGKEISKPALNNSKWAVSNLTEERETENYNNRIKQNLNYTETKTTNTNQLKTGNNDSCKRGIREIKATI
jgi:hypothetical protein